MKFRFSLCLLVIVALVVSIRIAHSQIPPDKTTLPSNSEKCHLTFGLTEWKPGQYTNASGELVGVQIDLIRTIAQNINCEISFVEDSWINILEKLRNGEVDFTGNATPSKKRREYGLFSIPYHQDLFTIYVLAEAREKFNFETFSGLKLAGFNLGLTEDYIYGQEIKSWKNDKKYAKYLSYASSTDDNMERLFRKEIDGVLEDPFTISYRMRAHDLKLRVLPLPVRSVGLEVCFMFSKKTIEQKFVERFNLALKQIKMSPQFHSIWSDPEAK